MALNRFYADECIFTNEDGVASTKAKEIANITDVFVKRSGRWQCVASQSSRITSLGGS